MLLLLRNALEALQTLLDGDSARVLCDEGLSSSLPTLSSTWKASEVRIVNDSASEVGAFTDPARRRRAQTVASNAPRFTILAGGPKLTL